MTKVLPLLLVVRLCELTVLPEFLKLPVYLSSVLNGRIWKNIWKTENVNPGLMFCSGCIETLFNTDWCVLPVGVSGIISMLNLCDINEKFPNSNT